LFGFGVLWPCVPDRPNSEPRLEKRFFFGSVGGVAVDTARCGFCNVFGRGEALSRPLFAAMKAAFEGSGGVDSPGAP